MTYGHIGDPNYLLDRLRPLLFGQAVKLVQEAKRRHGRFDRIVNTGVLIAPGYFYGFDKDSLVVSLLGKGSCVIFVRSPSVVSELVSAGMPIELAKALIENLKKLYGEDL